MTWKMAMASALALLGPACGSGRENANGQAPNLTESAAVPSASGDGQCVPFSPCELIRSDGSAEPITVTLHPIDNRRFAAAVRRCNGLGWPKEMRADENPAPELAYEVASAGLPAACFGTIAPDLGPAAAELKAFQRSDAYRLPEMADGQFPIMVPLGFRTLATGQEAHCAIVTDADEQTSFDDRDARNFCALLFHFRKN